MTELLHIDFVNNPELALDPDYAAQILVIGMRDGVFTGHRLSQFHRAHNTYDFRNARTIVNGHDRDAEIAEWAR
jgi:putative chitinase